MFRGIVHINFHSEKIYFFIAILILQVTAKYVHQSNNKTGVYNIYGGGGDIRPLKRNVFDGKQAYT